MGSERIHEVTAIVLAGGRGTRIAGMHPGVPKPMIPVAGRPFLHWVSAFLAWNGIERIIYSTGHLSEQIELWVKARAGAGRERCCREELPLGTGGAVITTARAMCDSPWMLVLNGDSLLLVDLRPGISRAIAEGWDGVIWSVRVDDASNYGSLVVDKQGTLVEFREKVPGRGLINAGIYLLRSGSTSGFSENAPLSLERDVVPGLLRGGRRILVQEVTGDFLDIGTPQNILQADVFIAKNASWFAGVDTE